MQNLYHNCMNFEESLAPFLDKKVLDDLLKSLELSSTHCLFMNESKINENELKKSFKSLQNHKFIKNAFYYDGTVDQPGKHYLFDNGAYYIIDASSLVVSYFLDAKENDVILDMCAAPGGKSISSALTYKNIEIISNDINKNRASLIVDNVQRMGLSNITITSSSFDKIYTNYQNSFDKIILDAPCSCSGMFRKNDESLKDWTYEKVIKCSLIQKDLLKKAFFMLKPGGTLIYSTCSFNFEENEQIILNLLENEPNAIIENLSHIPGEYRSKILPQAIHLLPSLYEGEGFFLCKIKKNSELLQGFCSKNTKFESKTSYQKLFNLNFKNEQIINENIYLYNSNFNLKPFYILQRGLLLGKIKSDVFVPSFHLAHYLSSENSLKLTEDEFKKYVHGDTFYTKENIKNGFYIVSYNNINLGFVKNVNGQLKNYYPKFYRH